MVQFHGCELIRTSLFILISLLNCWLQIFQPEDIVGRPDGFGDT